MLTYSFSRTGSESLYIQLYHKLKGEILSGELQRGFRLPSKRSFAQHLGISTITIENAYRQLTAEGYLESIPRRGFFVADINNAVTVVATADSIQKMSVPSSAKHPVFRADFVSNQPGTFPFSVWARLMREVISRQEKELMTVSPCGGIMELREAIAEHLFHFRKIQVSPEQIIIGAGTEYLYSLLILLLGKEHIFAAETPGYRKISQIYRSHGVSCRLLPVNSHGVSMEALLQSDTDILHLSPSHHFPTGVVTPISRRYELLAWASEQDHRYIIEDDYDSEFRLSGKPVPSLFSIDAMGKVIYINTFTKSLSPTIRISYMVLPPLLVQKFRKILGFYSCTVSNFEQYTLSRFLKEGYFEKHINRMRRYYRDLRNSLMNAIRKNPLFPQAVICEEDAGLHFLLRLNTQLSDAQLTTHAEKAGVRIAFLSSYYETPPEKDSHTVVLNYSSIPAQKTEAAIALLGECLFGEKINDEILL